MQAAISPITRPITALLRVGELGSVVREISDIRALMPPSGIAIQFNQPRQGMSPTHIRHKATVDTVWPIVDRPLLEVG